MIENKLEIEKANRLYAEIRAVLEKARSSAFRAVNLAMVQAYWQIGYLIVEHEQEGKERTEYGKALLKELSGRLSNEFGKGCDVTNLRKMRQFYLLFSKLDAMRLKSDKTKGFINVQWFGAYCSSGIQRLFFAVYIHISCKHASGNLTFNETTVAQRNISLGYFLTLIFTYKDRRIVRPISLRFGSSIRFATASLFKTFRLTSLQKID